MKGRQYQLAGQVAGDLRLGPLTRLYYERRRLKSGRMSRKRYWVAVQPGDPRYEAAPYAMTTTYYAT